MVLKGKELLEHLWQSRKQSVLIVIDLIKRYYKEDKGNPNYSDVAALQARLDKAPNRLSNLIDMRADEELSKEGYQNMRVTIGTEFQQALEISDK